MTVRTCRHAALLILALLPVVLRPVSAQNVGTALRPPLPILLQMNRTGWTPDAPLDAQMTLLPIQRSHGVKVRCWEVRYHSHDWRGKPVTIFGFYGVPLDGVTRHAALLMLHGGGGWATLDRVVENGARGFAALSIDLPGKGTNRDARARSTGPDMTVPQIFTVTPALTDNYLYHAVLAARRGLTFLARRPEVDSRRIGLMGASWGGVIGLLTTSVDGRVACLVDIFGAGFVRDGSVWQGYFERVKRDELALWEQNFDASRYAPHIHVPVLGVTATNDACYWLPQFQRTMRLISPEPCLLTVANLNHKLDQPAVDSYYAWLKQRLGLRKSAAVPIPWMRVRGQEGKLAVSFFDKAGRTPQRVEVFYVPLTQRQLARQVWRTVRCAAEGKKWSANLQSPAPLTMIYVTAHYADGTEYSTPMHSVAQDRLNGQRLVMDVPFWHHSQSEIARYYVRQVRMGCAPDRNAHFWRGLLEQTGGEPNAHPNPRNITDLSSPTAQGY